MELIKNIAGPQIIYSLYMCSNWLFLCSIKNENDNYAIVEYKYENEEMKKIASIELKDGTVVSGSNDNLIKLWGN